MPQVRVGWRSGTVAAAAPSVSAILDSYSGAAAAYSLRKLRSGYTGSAIRVRRSSDNTELNIGFDSDGNLDTYALSAFVGTGNGFVTTWYDQSGNSRNVTQTTASAQPIIISSGVIILKNNKPAIDFTWGQFLRAEQRVIGLTQTSIFNIFSIKSLTERNFAWDIGISTGNQYFAFDINTWQTSGQKFGLYASGAGFDSTAPTNLNQNLLSIIANTSYYVNISSNTSYYINNVLRTLTNKGSVHPDYNNATRITIGNLNGENYYFNGTHQEFIVYQTNQSTNRSSIESNINSYYSVYPNPTSVWNLLAAAYNADTKSLPSLKTSLVAAYNGESNTNDSFGTNNGTAVGGLTYGTGKIGNAFNLNGTTSYIEVGDKFDLGLSSWSYSIWFYPTNLSFNRTLFSKTAWAAGGGRIVLNIESALITFTLTLSDGNHILIRDNSTVLPGNQWVNLTVVVDRNDKIKLYYNGVLSTNVVNLGSVNNNLIPYINDNLNNTRPFRIGCGSGTDGFNPETPTRFTQGGIDSFNIWNKVLTQAEITELYNSGNGAQYIGDNFYKPSTNDALNTYNGTAQGGLTYGVGKVGTAFQFNGTTSLVSLPTNSMKFTGDFSYSVWVNLASISGYQSLISNYINAGGDYGNYILINPSGKLEFWGYATSTTSFAMASVTTFNTNTWYHVSVTKSASSVKIYVNGVLERTNSVGVPITYFSTMYPAIGSLYKWNGSLSAYFVSNGSKIDAVGIWNRELTQAEVTELYNSGNGKQYPN